MRTIFPSPKTYMLDERLRGVKDHLLLYIGAPFLNIHPSVLTSIAFCLGLVSCYCALQGMKTACLWFWILNRLFDGLDGYVARATKRQSDFGGYYDIICDFSIYAFLPLCLAEYAQDIAIWKAVCLFEAVCFINAASLFMLSGIMEKKAYNKKKLTTVHMPPAMIEGTETVVFFCYSTLYPSPAIFALFSILVLGNIIQRLYWAHKYL
jgi:phosphatidylglycerophosphate synthase